MNTEITYKYKDDLHEDVKCGKLILDGFVYLQYVGKYGTYTGYDNNINKLTRRLLHCHLRATGDVRCKAFLKDIYDFSKVQEFKRVYQFLLKQEIIEVIFQMC